MKNSSSPKRSLPASLYDQTYFLSACEGHEEFVESHGERLSRRLESAFEHAAVLPGMAVLDVGCGRGEILSHCARLNARAIGIDYAPVAVALSRETVAGGPDAAVGLARADAKVLPFPPQSFDRVLMFDVVEHLYPWELEQALREAWRVLRPSGKLVVHTAPNAWYDRFAYRWVRLVRILMGQGDRYPRNPRALNVAANIDVHVNEQSAYGLWRELRRQGFRRVRAWLASPPQNRDESRGLAALRRMFFRVPPFRWFFEREVFAVGQKP